MRTKTLICLALLLLLPSIWTKAQSTTKTFSVEDGSFSFAYPGDWLIQPPDPRSQIQTQKVYLSNVPFPLVKASPDAIQVMINLPQPRAYYGMLGGAITPAKIVKRSIQSSQAMPMLTFGTPPADGTPELLDLQPAPVSITEFQFNGRPAARVLDEKIMLGVDSGYMIVVLDVGNDKLVALTTDSPKGGLAMVKKYEAVIVAIAQSIHYAPKIVFSGNPDLPQVYSGTIGIWRRGTGRFFYPANWVAFTFASQMIQNTSERIDTTAPKAGQLIAVIQGPSEGRAGFDPTALFDQCNTQASDLTAAKLIEKLTTLKPAQTQHLKDNGITISTPETTTTNGKILVYLYQTQGELENLVISIDLGKGNIPSISAYAKRGEMKQFQAQLLAIAGTFEFTPQPCDNPLLSTPTAAP